MPTATSNGDFALPKLIAALILASAICVPSIFGEQTESEPPPHGLPADGVQLTFFEVSSYSVWPEGTSPTEELNAGLPHLKQAAAAAPLVVLSAEDIASYSLCPLHLEFVLSENGTKRLLEAIEGADPEFSRSSFGFPSLLGKGFLLSFAGRGVLGGEGSFRGTPRIYRSPVVMARFDPPAIALQMQPWGNYVDLDSFDLDKAWKLDRAGIRQYLDGAELPMNSCGEVWI